MSKFEMPKMDVARFDVENIITTSGGSVAGSAGDMAQSIAEDALGDLNAMFEFDFQ